MQILTNDIVNDGLVLYLDAGIKGSYPGSGTTWTDLAGSNDGTLPNEPTFDSANGGGIVFDEIDDYASISGSISLSSATFIAWIKKDGAQNGFTGLIFSRGSLPPTGMNLSQGGNNLGYHWNDNGYNWDSGLTVPNLSYCMIALNVSSNSVTAYLCTSSGITSAVTSVSYSPVILDNIAIGSDPIITSRFFKGNFATALIYNRALSAAEIAQNFEATRNRFGI